MPPRIYAKKAKARAKAKAKAKAKVKAEADENKPSFDVDESVAAAVLEKVTSTRDRVALACVRVSSLEERRHVRGCLGYLRTRARRRAR